MVFVLSYFVMFCCYLLDLCSFLTRDRKIMDPHGRGDREELGEKERGKTVFRLCSVGKESLLTKDKKLSFSILFLGAYI